MSKRIGNLIRRAQRRSSYGGRRTSFQNPRDCVAAYKKGMVGVVRDPEEEERFDQIMAQPDGAVAGSRFAGKAEGELVAHFPHLHKLYPGCMPGPAQGRGDCVSHSTKNAGLYTMCMEIVSGKPDPVTGEIEGAPEISTAGRRNGVLSTEAIYWYRDHNGDGWSCSHAANVAKEESGLWLRQNYPDLGFDLTEYSSRLAGKWGRPNPPDQVTDVGQEHLVREVTRLRSAEEIRDYLANGYGVSTCGGEGFSSSRDSNGVSRRRGSWAHAMAFIGFDDRPWAHRTYGGPLVLVLNSWGSGWIGGPRKIHDTNIEIPHGSFWARWRDVSRRSMYAYSNFDGFPPQDIPNWGFAV